MTTSEALDVICQLAAGVDPATGEAYPLDSPYQRPDIIRALYAANAALELALIHEERLARLPGKHGLPWSPEEDERLGLAFDAGEPLSALCAELDRTSGSVRARLMKLGRISVTG